MERDRMNEFDADDLIQEAQDEIEEIINNGGTLDDIETVIMDYFGLEPDYVMDFL